MVYLIKSKVYLSYLKIVVYLYQINFTNNQIQLTNEKRTM
jgi:hypothetical protein